VVSEGEEIQRVKGGEASSRGIWWRVVESFMGAGADFPAEGRPAKRQCAPDSQMKF
jgi:hypothetical protein